MRLTTLVMMLGLKTCCLSFPRCCANGRNSHDGISIFRFFNSAASCEIVIICKVVTQFWCRLVHLIQNIAFYWPAKLQNNRRMWQNKKVKNDMWRILSPIVTYVLQNSQCLYRYAMHYYAVSSYLWLLCQQVQWSCQSTSPRVRTKGHDVVVNPVR